MRRYDRDAGPVRAHGRRSSAASISGWAEGALEGVARADGMPQFHRPVRVWPVTDLRAGADSKLAARTCGARLDGGLQFAAGREHEDISGDVDGDYPVPEMYPALPTGFGVPRLDGMANSVRSSRGCAYQTRIVPSSLAVTISLAVGAELCRADRRRRGLPAASAGAWWRRPRRAPSRLEYPATICFPSGLNAASQGAAVAARRRVATDLAGGEVGICLTLPSLSAVTTSLPSGLNCGIVSGLWPLQ